jgi:hypothetical protein
MQWNGSGRVWWSVGKTKVLVRWSLDNSPNRTPAFSLRLVCSDQQNILSGSLVDMIFILFLYMPQFGMCSGLVSNSERDVTWSVLRGWWRNLRHETKWRILCHGMWRHVSVVKCLPSHTETHFEGYDFVVTALITSNLTRREIFGNILKTKCVIDSFYCMCCLIRDARFCVKCTE